MAVSYLPVSCLLLCAAMAGADHHMTPASALAPPITHLLQQVFAEVAPAYDNIVFSPYSLHSALTMTSMGADGQTRTEMNEALGITDMSEAAVNQAYMTLIESFNDTVVDAYTANAIFQNPTFNITQEFKDMVAEKYHAKAEMLNFEDPKGPEAMVNDYVAENTNNMITNLFDANSFSLDTTKLVLVNTLFFNGSWKMPFDESDTAKGDFHVSMDEKVQVDMMMKKGTYHMKFTDDYDVLKLPFEGDRFSLYFAIPNDTIGLNNPRCLAFNLPDDFFTELQNMEANVSVPKFEIKFKSSLPAVLQRLGMARAFTENAEFPKIDEGTQLTEVMHQAVIEVTEHGTVAAAATGAVASVTSVQPGTVREFKVDRPFFFFLRDDVHKAILFMGKYTKPAADPSAFVQEMTRDTPACPDPNDGNHAAHLTPAVVGLVLSAICSLAMVFRAIE